MARRQVIPVAVLLSLLVTVGGCGGRTSPTRSITLATTTSTRDSGLLEVLVPMFERQSGIEVKVVAVGSGQALALGRRGDADVLLTHAPEAEKQFVAEGHAERRAAVMHNDFVIVGPETDPAGINGLRSVADALRRIAASKSPFVSRGDESGTHLKERRLWEQAGVGPAGGWYVEAGAGMAQALRMASQMAAYTLSDRGTFLAQRRHLDLVILCQGDPALMNYYSVMVVSPARHPGVQQEGAAKFAAFLLSPAAQRAIAEFGVERFGQPLFFADAGQPGR